MMVTGWLSHDCGLPLLLAILVGLIVGAACGLGNGFLVTRAKLPPFIATLSMMTITRGLANIITDGRQIVGYPAWFDNLATVRYLGFFSITVVLFILLVILGWIHLGYRAVGRSLYAIGGSRKWRGLPASASETLPPWYTSVLEFYRLWLGLCWPAGSTPPNPARLRQDVVFAL